MSRLFRKNMRKDTLVGDEGGLESVQRRKTLLLTRMQKKLSISVSSGVKEEITKLIAGESSEGLSGAIKKLER